MPSLRAGTQGAVEDEVCRPRYDTRQGGLRPRLCRNNHHAHGPQDSFRYQPQDCVREAARNTPSKAFNLTAGETDVNEQDKNKSGRVLYPAAQLIINNDGELQLELRQNPWQLVNIIDWNKSKE